MSEAPTSQTPIPQEYLLRLPKPSYVVIETPDGKHSYREDSFVMLRMLLQAEKKPDEAQRWKAVKEWLADKLKVDESEISENMALHFHNQVVDFTNAVKKEMAKDVFTIASSAQPIQESQQSS